MIRFSKKVEYAILALQFLSNKEGGFATAKEMSDTLNVPYEFLSKLLQTLMKKGLIVSNQGVKGGYKLSRPAQEIAVDEVFRALDEDKGVVECYGDHNEHGDCSRKEICNIRTPMGIIQGKINDIFKQTTIANLNGEKYIQLEKNIIK